MAVGQARGRVVEHFAGLVDSRVERAKRHELLDIIVITICRVICGADNWVEIAEFGNARREWLSRFLEPVYNLFRISTVKASTTICRLVLSFLSQFFQSRRHFSSQAKDRSTTHRFGSTTKVCSSLRFTTSTAAPNRPCTAVAKGFPV